MSLVHYKFKSSLDYQHVKFDGLHISVGDLKKEIVAQKNLRLGDFELEIANAQTGSVYRNNSTLIPRNASVVVYRVPAKPCAASSTQKSWEAYKQEAAKAREQQKQLSLEQLKQTADLANANASEIDKVIAAVAQSNKGFEPSSYVGRHHTGPVSDGYICNRCQQTGHYVANCPNKAEVLAPHIKRTTGIPNSFLTYVDDPLAPGALLTHHGHFAVPTIDAQAYREGKKERPPFLPQPKTTGMEKPAIPVELKCGLCQDLLTDAVVIPCCGNSYCDECIRDALLETEGHQCPTCGQYDVSPNGIISNNSLRSAVTAFTNDSGYSKARRKSADGRAPVSQQRQPPQQSVQHHNPPQHHKPVHPQHNQMSPSNPQHNQMSPSNPQPPPPHRNAPPQEHPRPPRHPQSLPSHLQGPHHSLHQPRPRRLTSKASPRSRPHMEGGLPHDPSHMSPDSPLLPTPHASSSGHQLHGGLVLRPNVPPAVSHHHHPPGFPDQRRVEAPPVYVSSTLTAADSNSRYSPRGAYEEDGSEQVIAVVGSQAQPVRGRGGGLRGSHVQLDIVILPIDHADL